MNQPARVTSNSSFTALSAAAQPILRFGHRGAGVEQLQQQLGRYVQPVSLDGDFGLRTLHAVRTFQYSFFLREDGVVGRKTWEALLSGQPPALPTLQIGSQGQAVAWVQQILTRLGVYAAIERFSQVDGIYGCVTRDAVKHYQTQCASLIVDGIVGMHTWRFLAGDRYNAERYPIVSVDLYRREKRHTRTVSAIATTPGIQFFFTSSTDTQVLRWEATGTPDRRPDLGDQGAVSDIAINPVSHEIVSSTFGGTLRTTDFRQTNSSHRTFPGRGGSVRAIDISTGGQLIAAGNTDSSLRLFNARGSLLAERNLHTGEVTDVRFNPRQDKFSGQLVSVDTEQQIILWEGASDMGHPDLQATVLDGAPVGLRAGVAKASVAISNNGYEIAFTAGPTLKIFSSLGGFLYSADYGIALNAIAFSPCGRYLAIARGDHSLWILDLRTIKASTNEKPEVDILAPISVLECHTAPVSALAFSDNSAYLYSGDTSGELLTWKIKR